MYTVVLGWPKSPLRFFLPMAKFLVVFNFIQKIWLDCIATTLIPACIKKKKPYQIGEFLCSHFNIEDGRKQATFLAYYDYFRKGKNATKTHRKRCVQCVEKVLRLIECVKSDFRSFLGLLTFWPDNSLLRGCLMHWKVFSSTPGLYPLESNSER